MRSLTGTVRLVTALLAGAVVLAGCSSASGSGGSGPSASPSATTSATTAVDVPGLPAEIDYVALGDSFTAGPLLAPYADDGGGCLRSAGNYPSLLAERLGVASFSDVSCSGATVGDLFRAQRSFTGGRVAPPQLAALSADTDLVTVGIGGNDENLFGSPRGCLHGGGNGAGVARSSHRPGVLGAKVASARRVEARPWFAPLRRSTDDRPTRSWSSSATPTCCRPRDGARRHRSPPPTMPRSRGWRPPSTARSRARSAQHATYVDLAAASRGHDICAGREAWVNGAQMKPGRAAAYHPYGRGMRGAADEVYSALAAGH